MNWKDDVKLLSHLYCFPGAIQRPAADVSLVSRQLILKKGEIPSVHASTVLPLEDGTVLAAFFGGTDEGEADVRIYVAKRNVFGLWEKPLMIPSDDHVPHWNPVLDRRKDGSIRLYFKKGKKIPDWETWFCDSFDGGACFTKPCVLVPGDSTGGRGPVKNKCLRTRRGLLLAPASSEQGGDWRIFVDVSEDDGNTFERTPFIEVKNPQGDHVLAIQPTFWQDTQENVHLLCRTKGDGYVYRSDSFDGGRTFSTAYRTKVRNNNSGLDCCKSDDGRLWLLCNPVSPTCYRSPLRLLVSCDNGKNFLPVYDLERSVFSEFSYPAITAVRNRLYCTYTHCRTNIGFVEFQI